MCYSGLLRTVCVFQYKTGLAAYIVFPSNDGGCPPKTTADILLRWWCGSWYWTYEYVQENTVKEIIGRFGKFYFGMHSPLETLKRKEFFLKQYHAVAGIDRDAPCYAEQ